VQLETDDLLVEFDLAVQVSHGQVHVPNPRRRMDDARLFNLRW
jgi:hypothetical protein